MHKKLLLWVVLMGMLMLFLSLSVGGATQEPAETEPAAKVEKCVIPAGKPFVIFHRQMGPIPVFSPVDSTITILKVVVAKDGVTEIAEFSLSYDKPALACQVHGSDPYDTYKQVLHLDLAMVKKDFLTCEE